MGETSFITLGIGSNYDTVTESQMTKSQMTDAQMT
jgi:hypothetical protein